MFSTSRLLYLIDRRINSNSNANMRIMGRLISNRINGLTDRTVGIMDLLNIDLVRALEACLRLRVLRRLRSIIITLRRSRLRVISNVVSLLIVRVRRQYSLERLIYRLLRRFRNSLLVSLLVMIRLRCRRPLTYIQVTSRRITRRSILLARVMRDVIIEVYMFRGRITSLVTRIVRRPTLLSEVGLIRNADGVRTSNVLNIALLR